MCVDEKRADAGALQALKPNTEQGLAIDWHQALGQGIGQRAQAGAQPCRKEQSPHYESSRSNSLMLIGVLPTRPT